MGFRIERNAVRGARLVFITALALLTFAGQADAAFPGANGKIAFESFRDGNSEIYTMNADGSNPTNLTNNTSIDLEPAWSPDGTKIAFTTLRDGNYEVYTMNADGTNQTNITNNPAVDASPAWSPDGTKIAFSTGRNGFDHDEIYTMNADGSNPTRLTTNTTQDLYPAWSPAGAKIAFVTYRNVDGSWEIYTMNADGSSQTNITNNPAYDTDPAWSPDGSKIAFTTARDGHFTIYTMNADGSNQTRLTNNTASDFEPAWSPDGTKIAFETNRDSPYPGNDEIFTMNADGTTPTNLTNNPNADARPDWQPVTAAPTPCTVRITNGGWIVTDDGDRASFGGVAQETSTGANSGSEQYQDKGPAEPMSVHSLQITDVTCDETETNASIFGTATIDGTGSHSFQIDVADNGSPGKGTDHYRIRIPDVGYDSGDHLLRAGNVQIH